MHLEIINTASKRNTWTHMKYNFNLIWPFDTRGSCIYKHKGPKFDNSILQSKNFNLRATHILQGL